jgi:F0F1-type ATP synthase membrane subunit a
MAKKADLSKFTFAEWFALVWFCIDAFTHLTIEFGYVCLALTTTARKSDTYLGWIWREYGRADARWAVRDVNVISLEILTVFVGVLCIFQAYAVATRASYRHPLQMVICVAELYGGWMTFAPEWLDGSPNLNGSSFSLLWIYLVFMNGLWVVVPALLLWESFSRLSQVRSVMMFKLSTMIVFITCILVGKHRSRQY